MIRIAAGVALTAVLSAGVFGAQDSPKTVLSDQTIWRHYVVFRPPVVSSDGECSELVVPRNPWVKRGEWLSSPMPDNAWKAADFDDSGWPRKPGPLFGGYGGYRPAGIALLCVRGRFAVTEASRAELKLSVKYRGGLVAYINGKEFARGHMPKGQITPLTVGAEYRREAFVKADGRTPLQSYGRRNPPADLVKRYESRIRKLTVRIPANLLRKGVNVLALELHRSPVPEGVPAIGRGSWDTTGLVGVELTSANPNSVRANTKAPACVQIWSAGVMLRIGKDVHRGDPFEPSISKVRLHAPRNGVACGQVVVSSPEPIPGLSARAAELKNDSGDAIRPGAIRIRYAGAGSSSIPLFDKPEPDATIQPIWITISVPSTATAGIYRGQITIGGLATPATVSVELTVSDWKLPAPKDWRTVVNLLQSPESVAGYYKVPLWSDEHFKFMVPSMELMGQMGNDVIGISAVARSVFGDDPMILFRKEDGRYVPDLKVAERYLKMYDKYVGQPKFLSVNVWSYGMYYKGWGRDGGKTVKRSDAIPVIELRDGKRIPAELSIYGRPGTEELWRGVMRSLDAMVRKLGWREDCLMLGTSGDTWPSKETIAFFRKIAPGVQWRVLTHGGGAPKWGLSDYERTQANGMTVGYLEIARRIRSGRIHVPGHPATCNARDLVKSDPFALRSLPISNTISSGFDGFCWKGLDYWDYITPEGKRRNALNTYVRFGNMVGGTPRKLAAPGPKGAVPTVQLEMLRLGVQECEAALSIRENLTLLYPRADEKLDVMHLCLEGALSGVKRRDGSTVPSIPRRDLQFRLLYSAGAADKGKVPSGVLSKSLFFSGGKHKLEFDSSKSGTGLDVRIEIGDDRWSKGGVGSFSIQFKRDGKACRGTFTGVFEGVRTQGKISGSFTPGGFIRPSKKPPVVNDLTRRCDAVINDLAAALLTGSRVSPQGGTDVERLVMRLYTVAGEVTRAVKDAGK